MGSNTAFVGVRVGDEGKGARVLHYVKKAMNDCPPHLRGRSPVMVYRWHGGPNAGHTATTEGRTYKFHQIPVGVLVGNVYNLQGSGVYLNPRKEVLEIDNLRAHGVSVSPDNLGIASNAFVILDSHVDEDAGNLTRKEHTSTGNGIRQVARDKYDRVGIRFAEFLDPNAFSDALEQLIAHRSRALRGKTVQGVVDSYANERETLGPFMALQERVFQEQGMYAKIGEGAHGFDIDIEEGLYPGVTSSHPSIIPHRPERVVGVVKLYDSSVGHNRPFVGRLANRTLETTLRDTWGERGTTTGKDRMIGWLDLVAASHAINTIGVDCLIGNCGDRLEELARCGEDINVVVGYSIGGKDFPQWDPSFHKRGTLYDAKPILKSFKPWTTFLSGSKLSSEAQRFVDFVQHSLETPFVALGTGPDESDLLTLQDI